MESMAKRIVRYVANIIDLPDEILSHIISFLPIKEAVGTSILSRRWKDVFTLLSNLDLEVCVRDEEQEWLKFVDRLVFNRDISTIQRFRLQCNQSDIDPHRIGIWICSLVWHKIQELDFEVDCPLFNYSSLSQSLFCCESLVVLKLNLCCDELNWKFHELKVSDRVCLPRLKFLHLEDIEVSYDGSIERLFSSCPVLEDLVLDECYFSDGHFSFHISNQNLKRLTLDNVRGDVLFDILIDAPSLVLLNYNVSRYYSLELKDSMSLAKVDINLGSDYWPDDDYEHIPNLRQIQNAETLKEIQDIKTLEVQQGTLQDFEEYNVPIPLFDKMTCLKIRSRSFWLDSSLEYFLTRCVVLETLVFEESTLESFVPDARYQYSLQRSQLTPLLCHLETIEIMLSDDMVRAEAYMEVIAFFLENATVLEEVKIRSARISHPTQQAEVITKLLNFPRASKKCRLVV